MVLLSQILVSLSLYLLFAGTLLKCRTPTAEDSLDLTPPLELSSLVDKALRVRWCRMASTGVLPAGVPDCNHSNMHCCYDNVPITKLALESFDVETKTLNLPKYLTLVTQLE